MKELIERMQKKMRPLVAGTGMEGAVRSVIATIVKETLAHRDKERKEMLDDFDVW